MRRARLNTLARHAAVVCAMLVATGLTALVQNQPPLITRFVPGRIGPGPTDDLTEFNPW
jgi:hypothetical protein